MAPVVALAVIDRTQLWAANCIGISAGMTCLLVIPPLGRGLIHK